MTHRYTLIQRLGASLFVCFAAMGSFPASAKEARVEPSVSDACYQSNLSSVRNFYGEIYPWSKKLFSTAVELVPNSYDLVFETSLGWDRKVYFNVERVSVRRIGFFYTGLNAAADCTLDPKLCREIIGDVRDVLNKSAKLAIADSCDLEARLVWDCAHSRINYFEWKMESELPDVNTPGFR